ncbi:hypothetical protein BOX15_Mlig006863g1 [Macrostomum lignano]|uniref:palmitoyl-protein hydrolase n=2 Tax=Macrostomum lignano TaxID=282301 RepID=A0A1I8JJ83_9PLAT|nr:hypothetical protein BOX15_Mlig021974g1 [Macrostomum lignano]PAA69727.1 hypothetical protein BOX15_Mlig006863g1 [Macrostomum lignano]
MSCADLFRLFCWPPLPSRIAAKLAFLPPEPTYSIIADGDSPDLRLHLSERAEFQFSDPDKASLEVFLAPTARGNNIACMMAKVNPRSRFTLLFSHGNAVDLGQMSSFFIGLGRRLNVNVFGYDYSGYGASTGRPLEKNLYADMECAWNQLLTRYKLQPESIILYGQSIGTVPTVDLAARYKVAGVILHSPLMSGMRVAFPETQRTWFFDPFPNIEKAPRIQSPCLVIHGTDDEVIDFAHGLTIYERLPKPVDPLWVVGAGHNDIEMFPQYLERLRSFLYSELDALRPVAEASAVESDNNSDSPTSNSS